MDVVAGWLGKNAYRCRECRERFYRTKLPGEPEIGRRRERGKRQRAAGRSKRLLRMLFEAAIVVLMVVMLWMFLSYITTGHDTPESGRLGGVETLG